MVVKGDMHKGFDPIELKGDVLLWWDGPRAFQLDDHWTIWEWHGWEAGNLSGFYVRVLAPRRSSSFRIIFEKVFNSRYTCSKPLSVGRRIIPPVTTHTKISLE